MTRQAPAAERADKWISRAATSTVAGLAGIAGAISYSHMRLLAAAHGDGGWHAHAFPLSVDGVEIVASLVLLADRRSGRRSGWLPWAALTVGTAASLAANVATADDGIVSRVIAGWPALALLIAVKLLSGIMEHGKAVRPVAEADTPGCGTVSPAAPSDSDPEHRPDPLRIAGHPRQRPPRSADSIEDMLPAARALRDGLRTDGRPLTRDALAAHLRGAGHRVGNDRLTQLLAALRDAAAT